LCLIIFGSFKTFSDSKIVFCFDILEYKKKNFIDFTKILLMKIQPYDCFEKKKKQLHNDLKTKFCGYQSGLGLELTQFRSVKQPGFVNQFFSH